MAKWSAGWKWSDGTKWADGLGVPLLFTSFIDRSIYRLSLKVTHTVAAGSTTAPVVMTMMAEAGVRPQLPDRYEAFIDRNEETQYISAKVFQTFDSSYVTELATEGGDTLATEVSESLMVGLVYPFAVDRVHILASRRAKQQPVG